MRSANLSLTSVGDYCFQRDTAGVLYTSLVYNESCTLMVRLSTILCCNLLNINYFCNTRHRMPKVLLPQIRDWDCDRKNWSQI